MSNIVVDHFRGETEFTTSKIFKITIPDDYDNSTELKTLAEKMRKGRYGRYDHFEDDITDENFAKVSYKLSAGETHQVILLPVTQDFTSNECLELLKRNNVVLTGAQGLSIVCRLKFGELPAGKWVLSFDEKDKLWQGGIGNVHQVPVAKRFPTPMGGGLSFDFQQAFENRVRKNEDCLLGFLRPD